MSIGYNVTPGVRKVVAESWARTHELIDLYDPSEIRLHRVTGGFNTAVQVSAPYSLRSYAQQVGEVGVIARTRGNRLLPALALLQRKIADPWWATVVLDPSIVYGFGFELTPHQLTYTDRTATILLRGTLSFMIARDKFVPPRPGLSGVPSVPMDPRVISRTPVPRDALPFSPPDPEGRPLRADVDPLGVAGVVVADLVEVETSMVPIHTIGKIEVTLTAPFESTEHVPQRSVDVWLDMHRAEIIVHAGAGDATLFYEEFLIGKESNLAAQIVPAARLPLTPTISLVGRNAANSRIDEFTEFETRVFAVSAAKRQALCIAFDVVPGCKGTIEDVRHFIGANDYGVIHDEYVAERIVRNKWNQGGFDRSIGLINRVSLKVRRDGRDVTEDAEVVGRLLLNTLDVVALVPHADVRTDVLRLGGEASTVVDRVILIDGTVLTAENADLGPEERANWGVDIAPSVTSPYEPDAELRDFKNRAHIDGIRHLGRPFSRFPISTGFPLIEYTRTEAIEKRLFFLGQLPTVFF